MKTQEFYTSITGQYLQFHRVGMEQDYLDNGTSLRKVYLGQRGEALLLNVPHELVLGELQALVHVELGHVHTHHQPALGRHAARRPLHHHYLFTSENKNENYVNYISMYYRSQNDLTM